MVRGRLSLRRFARGLSGHQIGRAAGEAARLTLDGRARPPTQTFSIFATLYMTSFLLDITEKWQYPGHALLALIGVPVIAAIGATQWRFAAFLVLSTLHYLSTTFPDVANHNNLFLLCNLALLAAILHSTLAPRDGRGHGDFFEASKAPLRVTLALVYFFTGFHKLNWDFFDPMVGCAATFSKSLLQLVLMPTSPVRVTSAVRDVALPEFAIVGMAVFVLVWELGSGLALWLRRLQLPILLVCLAMHLVLAQLAFFDFSSLAFALFLVFVPGAYWNLITESPIRVGPIRLRRDMAYLIINAIAAVAAGILFAIYGYREPVHRMQGGLFALASIIFLWPWLRQILAKGRRVRWEGVPMWGAHVSRWWVVFPLFIAFFAMNPYLGLRTAGTFTMFSNLRTEGDRSNHWLLGSNPLKLWGYQEDLVEIVDIDSKHQGRFRLANHLLPVVEFKKSIHQWREMGLDGLDAVFVYGGRVYRTDDVVRNNPWNIRGRTLEMFLLDFRVVQESPTPNACRW